MMKLNHIEKEMREESTDDFDDLTVDFYDKRIPQLLGKQIIKDIELF